jgi:polyhydroxyalkanoate synthase
MRSTHLHATRRTAQSETQTRRAVRRIEPPPESKPACDQDGVDDRVATQVAANINRLVHALGAQVTGGLSPAAAAEALFTWAIHLGVSPGKEMELLEKAQQKFARLGAYAAMIARSTSMITGSLASWPRLMPSPKSHRNARFMPQAIASAERCSRSPQPRWREITTRD